jgi:2-oxo-4-hydroxy-4-carboxy--5-ureidoimidazoline (OHCU) decarboxylase
MSGTASILLFESNTDRRGENEDKFQKEENEKFHALNGQTYITRFGFNFVLVFNAKNRTYNTPVRPCLWLHLIAEILDS